MNLLKSTDPVKYATGIDEAVREENAIVAKALAILDKRVNTGQLMNEPSVLKSYLIAHNAQHDVEVFSVVFLDTKHRLLKHVDMFRGTDNQTSVYPKEIAVKALQMRASALVMCHSHPSGDLSPSKADQRLTQIVKDAMAVLDLRCLDHIITGGGRAYSFAEHGLI